MSRRRPVAAAPRTRRSIPAVASRSDSSLDDARRGTPQTSDHRATRTTRDTRAKPSRDDARLAPPASGPRRRRSRALDDVAPPSRSRRSRADDRVADRDDDTIAPRRSRADKRRRSDRPKAGSTRRDNDSRDDSSIPTTASTRKKRPTRASKSSKSSSARAAKARATRPTADGVQSTAPRRPTLTTVPELGGTRTDRPRRTISKRSRRSPRVKTTSPGASQQRIPFKRYVHAPPPPPVFVYSEEDARRRMVGVMGLVVVILLLVLGRVGALQTTGGESLRDAASKQWTRTRNVDAPRGSIFDRNGEELAVSVPAYSVSVSPKQVEDPEAVVGLLTTALELSDDEIASLRSVLADKSRSFAFVRHHVDLAEGDALKTIRLPGINIDPEDKRVLPGGDTGRSVIGKTDVFNDGIAGLELQYNDMLKGTDGKVSREVAPKGNSIAGSEQVIEAPVPGDDIVLTIDRSIQFATEQVLAQRVEEVNAKSGTVIVMDTKSGDIYAMASVGRDEAGNVVVSGGNYAAVDAYEPGSVVKVITAAGGIDSGAVTPNTTFLTPYRREFNGHWLSDSHQHPDQDLSVSDILVESSNMGTIAIMEATGRQEHWEYMRKFGLGEKTALDFPNESSGILHPWDQLFGTEPYTVAYGQGVASTSIQLVTAVNVIANDGVYVAPRLISATVDANGNPIDKKPATTYTVVSEEAAVQTQEILRKVVCNGTAQAAQEGITEFSVAGKTGTGYKAQPNGTYLDENGNYVYYASFVGFFPAEDPQVTVLVSIDEPPSGGDERYGGTAAAPVFAKLAPTIVSELGIIPPKNPTACAAE